MKPWGIYALIAALIIDGFLFSSESRADPGTQKFSKRKITFVVEIAGGKRFEKKFTDGYSFLLEPNAEGWTISVRKDGSAEDLSRLSPPLHGASNPRMIEARHFADPDRAREDNAPCNIREFIFSPKVGVSIDGPAANHAPTPEDIKTISEDGSGVLKVLETRFVRSDPNRPPVWEKIRFQVDLTWNPSAFAKH